MTTWWWAASGAKFTSSSWGGRSLIECSSHIRWSSYMWHSSYVHMMIIIIETRVCDSWQSARAFQGGSSRHPRPQAWNSATNSFYSLSSCSLVIAILITMQMIIAILLTMQTMATILNEKGLAALGQHQHCNNNLDNYPFASVIIIIMKISMMIQMKWDLRHSIC